MLSGFIKVSSGRSSGSIPACRWRSRTNSVSTPASITRCATWIFCMSPGLPVGRRGVKFSAVFSRNHNINWLSVSRLFLFGARDVWFVVGIPIYLYSVMSDGSEAGNHRGWGARIRVGLQHLKPARTEQQRFCQHIMTMPICRQIPIFFK